MNKLVFAICCMECWGLIVLAPSPRNASADTIVAGEMTTIMQPTSNITASVEFYLDRIDGGLGNDDGQPLQVSNFQVRVELTGPRAGSDVTIIDVRETTNRVPARALDVTLVDNPTRAFGATFNLGDPFLIEDGAGLMQVDLNVPPDSFGSYQLNVLTGNDDTQLLGIDFVTLLPFDVSPGGIRIRPGKGQVRPFEVPPVSPVIAVPEPICPSWILLLGCLPFVVRLRNGTSDFNGH